MLVRYLVIWIVPLSIIALAIPMILEKVPRNYLYGFRTPLTLSSDAIWYRANKISGIALFAGGCFWLLVGQILPNIIGPQQLAYGLVGLCGAGAIMAGCAVSFWLIYRHSGPR